VGREKEMRIAFSLRNLGDQQKRKKKPKGPLHPFKEKKEKIFSKRGLAGASHRKKKRDTTRSRLGRKKRKEDQTKKRVAPGLSIAGQGGEKTAANLTGWKKREEKSAPDCTRPRWERKKKEFLRAIAYEKKEKGR